MNPTVTVIIPVLNAATMLRQVLSSLSEQGYPSDLTEIIVVDNGSTDASPEIAQSFGVKLLYEKEKKSPYAARNVGFQNSTGSIVALTDANKIPDRNWLEEGIKQLTESDADLVGGEIKFDISEEATTAEIFDSIMYNNNRKFVKDQQSSAAGNLFFKREVMEKVGPFPDQFRSGMDIWWTHRAVQQGYKLQFAEKAIVRCQPRKLKPLLKKSRRVGTLHPVNYKLQGKTFSYILEHTFRTFAPPKVKPLKKKLSEMNRSISFFNIWVVAWMCKIWMGLGRIQGLRFLKNGFQKKSE